MNAEAWRLLLVDDNPDDRTLVRRELAKAFPQATVDEVGRADQLEALLADPAAFWDVAITDYQLRWSTGLAVFRQLRKRQTDLPVILFTASGTEELAVEALKEGVADYITKSPRHYGRIPYAVRTSVESRYRRLESAERMRALQRREAQLQVAMDAGRMEAWEFDAGGASMLLQGRHGGPFAERSGPLPWSEFLEHVHPDDREHVRSAWATGIRAGRIEIDCRITARQTVRWIRLNAIPGGEAFASNWIGVMHDITDAKQMEADLRFANQQKSEFIAVLAHELRNPLAPLANIVPLLSAAPTPERLAWIRDVVSRQVGVMARLLDDLLDVNRLAMGSVAIKRQVVDFRVALAHAIDDRSAAMAERALALERAIPDEPVWVEVDPVRMQEMLDNLFDNAIKFTSHGGKLCVVLRVDADRAVFELHDTGIGIEADMLDRIFEPFVQSKPSPTQPNRGLGIGLSLVRQLALAHGGEAYARSAGPGRGATFTILLPLSRLKGDREACVAPAASARISNHILVADDEADVVETLAVVLRQEGYAVTTARDGASAVELAAQLQPKVLVLDIGMPNGGGLAVASWVRRQGWGSHSLLIAVSGWGRDEDRQRTREAGFDLHLVKPVEIRALMNAIASNRKDGSAQPQH